MTPLKYLQAYPPTLQDKVRQLIAQQRLGKHLATHYPDRHDVQSDKPSTTRRSTSCASTCCRTTTSGNSTCACT